MPRKSDSNAQRETTGGCELHWWSLELEWYPDTVCLEKTRSLSNNHTPLQLSTHTLLCRTHEQTNPTLRPTKQHSREEKEAFESSLETCRDRPYWERQQSFSSHALHRGLLLWKTRHRLLKEQKKKYRYVIQHEAINRRHIIWIAWEANFNQSWFQCANRWNQWGDHWHSTNQSSDSNNQVSIFSFQRETRLSCKCNCLPVCVDMQLITKQHPLCWCHILVVPMDCRKQICH